MIPAFRVSDVSKFGEMQAFSDPLNLLELATRNKADLYIFELGKVEVDDVKLDESLAGWTHRSKRETPKSKYHSYLNDRFEATLANAVIFRTVN